MTTPTTPKKRGRPKGSGPKLPAKAKAKPRVKTAPKVEVKPAPATNSLPINPFIEFCIGRPHTKAKYFLLIVCSLNCFAKFMCEELFFAIIIIPLVSLSSL